MPTDGPESFRHPELLLCKPGNRSVCPPPQHHLPDPPVPGVGAGGAGSGSVGVRGSLGENPALFMVADGLKVLFCCFSSAGYF